LVAWFGYDAAMMDVFGALASGASISIFDLREKGIVGLLNSLQTGGITVLHLTPTIFRSLCGLAPGRHIFESIRAVVLGGEEAIPDDHRLFVKNFPSTSAFVNGLGPTECTVALQKFYDDASRVVGKKLSVGRAVRKTRVRILNEDGDDVGCYGFGEIAIESPYLALGYWRQPELTASRFRIDDVGKRWYLSGDYGMCLPDGEVEYIGRRDRQVKIRGQLANLSEIECAGRLLRDVAECVALQIFTGESEEIVAFCVMRSNEYDSQLILQGLKDALPSYMIPQKCIRIDELPLLPNGKIDARRLEDIASSSTSDAPMRQSIQDDGASTMLPVGISAIESKILALWHKALDSEISSSTDNFFDIGGNSLLLVEVHAAMEISLGIKCSLLDLFQHPTVRSLCVFLQKKDQIAAVKKMEMS
jgi:acyl-coenzyme A synthetase/AMP-(fatty) acid ligase/acyl carrier protein